MGQPLKLHHWQRLFSKKNIIESNYILLENFENMPTGQINASLYTKIGTADDDTTIETGSTQYLRHAPHQFNEVFSSIIDPAISGTQPITFYSRFRIPTSASRINSQLRLPAGSNFRLKFDNDATFPKPFNIWYNDATMSGNPSTAINPINQTVSYDTWYEMWIYLDGSGVYEVWIRGGIYDESTRITVEDDDPNKYLYTPPSSMTQWLTIGWESAEVSHDDIFVSLGNGVNLEKPDVDRLWFDRSAGFTDWDKVTGAWKNSNKNVYADGDHVGFTQGSVNAIVDVNPSSILVGFTTSFFGPNTVTSTLTQIRNGVMRLRSGSIFDLDKIFISPTGRLNIESGSTFTGNEITMEALANLQNDLSLCACSQLTKIDYNGTVFPPTPQASSRHTFSMAQVDSYFGSPSTFTGAGRFTIPLIDIVLDFESVSSGNIDSQSTGFKPSSYFETSSWEAPTDFYSSRGFAGNPSSPLSYTGIPSVGGSLDAFRTTTFRSTSMTSYAELPLTYPRTNMTYDITGALFLSFLVDFSGYTARVDDHAASGVAVVFVHETAGGGGRPLGLHIGGATGGNSNNLKVSIITESKYNITESGFDLIDTGLTVNPTGANLVQLKIVDNNQITSNCHYQVIVNPATLADLDGPHDFEHTEAFGLATNNDNFGVKELRVGQCLNGIQNILVDQIQLSENARS